MVIEKNISLKNAVKLKTFAGDLVWCEIKLALAIQLGALEFWDDKKWMKLEEEKNWINLQPRVGKSPQGIEEWKERK